MSPPANTLGLLVWPVGPFLLNLMRPSPSVSIPNCANHGDGLGRKPNAMMTLSAGMISSLPATSTGTRRPLASGGPSSVVTTLTPSTLPLPTMATGWRLNRNCTPSSRALATSRRLPGMLASSRR